MVYAQVLDYLNLRFASTGRGTKNLIPRMLVRLIVHGDVRNEGPLIFKPSIYQRTCKSNPINHSQSDTKLREAGRNRKNYIERQFQ